MSPASKGATEQDALKAITLQNQIKSPLLRLPAEIRNHIYIYVLKDDIRAGIQLCVKSKHVPHRVSHVKKAPAHAHFPRHLLNLLEVCQQTHAETRQLVFNINPVNSDHVALDMFLWGAQRNVLMFDQWSSLKVILLEVSQFDLADGPGDTIAGFGWIIKGTIERLKRLAGLEQLIVTIRCVGSSPDDRGLPEESMLLLRRQVEEIIKQKSKAIKVEVRGLQSM